MRLGWRKKRRISRQASEAEARSGWGVSGWFLRGDAGTASDVVECLTGTAAKDNAEDLKKIRRYLEQRVSKRSGEHWRALYEARHLLPG